MFVTWLSIDPINISIFSCSQLWTMPHEEIEIRKARLTMKKSRHKNEWVMSINERVVRQDLGNSAKFQIHWVRFCMSRSPTSRLTWRDLMCPPALSSHFPFWSYVGTCGSRSIRWTCQPEPPGRWWRNQTHPKDVLQILTKTLRVTGVCAIYKICLRLLPLHSHDCWLVWLSTEVKHLP